MSGDAPDREVLSAVPGLEHEGNQSINVYKLLSNINSVDEPPFPLLYPEICVVLMLTETRGTGTAQIIVVYEETGQRAFGSRPHVLTFGNDPLAVVGVAFRLRDCPFPRAGMYSVQFWYNGTLVAQRPLRTR